MLPDNVISSSVIAGNFIQAKQFDVNNLLDYEDGGVAIGDNSQGRIYQIWRCRLIGDDITIDAPNDPSILPLIVYSAPNITEISFTFDSNLKPAVAFVQDSIPKLRWYDTSIPAYSVIDIPYAKTPRVALDDKRITQDSNRDIILGYIKNNCLCYRQQRDRFLIEYILTAGLYKRLIKMGMSSKLRMQFSLELNI